MSKKTTVPVQGNNDQDRLRSLLQEISFASTLPAGSTELNLIELDPQRVHVYWNIEPERARPDKRQILRVYDITATGDINRPDQSYDIPIRGREGRWYLDTWRGDRLFVAELGYLNDQGSLERLALSNEVRTPPTGALGDPAAFDACLDPHGKPVHTESPAHHEVSKSGDDATPTDADWQETVPEQPPSREFPLVFNEAEQVLEFIAPDEKIEPVEAEAFAPATSILAGETMVAFTEEELEQEDARAELEPVFPAADILEACAPENAAALDAFYREIERHPPPEPVTTKPAAVDQIPEATATRHTSAPASSQPQSPAPTPLEQIVGWSSLLPASGQDVLLEINAELHVYGRAKPGSNLTLHGQTIQLRPDGTFSIRRKLPSGAVVLPLLAKSTS